jgi:hypothetical protein
MALLPRAGAGFGEKSPSPPGGILDTALNIVDPAGIRLKVAGLFNGGLSSMFAKKTSRPGVISKTSTGTVSKNNSDWRVKISLPTGSGLYYQDPGNTLQALLKRTNGVVFPYTPSVTVTHNARYQEQSLTHSNYKNYFYEGSDVSPITITGDFTVQNVDEGLYLLAAIYFFRSATKMFFGTDDLAGNPPPIVYLDGYGDYYFPHVSCIITSFQHTMPGEVDYVEIPYSGAAGGIRSVYENNGTSSTTKTGIVRLPTSSQLQVTVQPVYSRNNIHNNMNLTAFGKGELLSGRGGFI